MTPPIAILGAGPSGLTLARLLHINNIDFVIYERDPTPNELQQGGTLDIHGNSGQLAIKEAGLHDQFMKVARSEDVAMSLANREGEVQARFDQSTADRPEIDRKVLRALLLASIPADKKIKWGKRVRDVSKTDAGAATVYFEDGTTASGFHLLVGADGAWSKARRLVNSAQPKYSGWFYLTSLIKPNNSHYPRVVDLAGQGSYMACGGGKMITAQRLGDGSYTTGVGLSLPERKSADAALADPSTFKQWLLDDCFVDYGKTNTDLIRHSEEHFRAWPLYAMPPESLSRKTWKSVSGVTLIGDAAHVTTPFEGEGVNCAMFDSLQLAQQIVKHGLDDLDAAVAEYEELMFPRGASLISRSAANGELLFAEDAPRTFVELMARAHTDGGEESEA